MTPKDGLWIYSKRTKKLYDIVVDGASSSGYSESDIVLNLILTYPVNALTTKDTEQYLLKAKYRVHLTPLQLLWWDKTDE